MMDLTSHHMYRMIVQDCYSRSIMPFPTQHDPGHRGLMWRKGELIQVTLVVGGDLFIARPLCLETLQHDPKFVSSFSNHVWKQEFRDLTDEEREILGLPKQRGKPIYKPEWRT